MARTIAVIQQEIIDAIQADATLSGLTSTSAVAIWRLVTRVIAAGLETEEQLNDVFRLELEQIAREAVPGTDDWLQRRVLEFQYDALSPQITQVVDGRVTYPVIDATLRVVTRAAIKTQSNNRTLVKVAKGTTTLAPLTSDELIALSGYLSRVGFAGIPIDVSSQQADRVRINNCIVYYLRQYNPVTVKAAVIEAVETYLKNISTTNFNGVVVRSEIIDAMQAVDGVALIGSSTLSPIIRTFAVAAPGGVAILDQREAQAGYAITEDASGYDLNSTITMTPDNLIPNV
tara:strand:- start:699 stop:1562 length:864 start_codon:yes stop_codon:yes gene_type:complete